MAQISKRTVGNGDARYDVRTVFAAGLSRSVQAEAGAEAYSTRSRPTGSAEWPSTPGAPRHARKVRS